jgi:PAS domain-containing protein
LDGDGATSETECFEMLALQASHGLEQSEARFRSLVQNAADVIGVLDVQGAVVYVSPAISRVIGRAKSSSARASSI